MTSLRSPDVLLVDDNAHMHAILKSLLRAFGIVNVSTALSAETAMDAIAQLRPDLAIVDINMPGQNGIDFVKAVRRNDDSPDPYLPIIMCSAYTEPSYVVACRDAGAMEFLAKPISAHALYTRVLYVLNNPRRFVRHRGYFGPCRRRKFEDEYVGNDRRRDALTLQA